MKLMGYRDQLRMNHWQTFTYSEHKMTDELMEEIEEKVDEIMRDVMNDPLDKLKEWDIPVKDWVDFDAMAQGMVDSDGYGIMCGYDGSYDSEYVLEKQYIIIRNN
jgi:hypothetical protein